MNGGRSFFFSSLSLSEVSGVTGIWYLFPQLAFSNHPLSVRTCTGNEKHLPNGNQGLVLCSPISECQQSPVIRAQAEEQWPGDRRSMFLFTNCLFPSSSLEADGGGFLSTESTGLGRYSPVSHEELLNWLPGTANVHLHSRCTRATALPFLCASCENLFHIPQRNVLWGLW